MMETLLAVDPYKKMASSDKVSFDLNHRCLNEAPSSVIVKSQEDYNPEVSIKRTPSKEWELDVRALISTKKWLQNYGLHKNKLAVTQVLPSIGFKMSDDFDWTLKRPVASRYAEGLFNQLMKPNGKLYNVTCGRDKLKQIESRLQQAIHLYKRRLEWLTSESRRLFGVIEERCLTVVLDIRNMSPQQFDLYRMALERTLYEQVTQVAKFNLIRAGDDIKMYQENCVPVTHDTVEGAIKWLWDLDRLAGVSNTACVEAVLRAVEDPQNEAVYLFTEGSSVDTCRQLLKEKVCALEQKPPIHVVSYNCENSDTVRFLREFATSAGGKFHIYSVIMEMDSYEGLPVDPNTNRANIVLKRKTFGGIPPGAGVREDVIVLFQEMEEARNTMIQIQKLIGITPEPNITLDSELAPVVQADKINEQYMSSRHWLEKYGLAARKLELFDILSGVAFHHKDGVVDVQREPMDEYQTDAIRTRKLVNAKYCDRFPVVRWKDGKVVHVQVTPELHRNYEQKMLVALRAIQNRIDWLNQGSRALFGTLIEDQIYIIIDTSESMVPSIQYVKDKLFLLMQEQLRHKMKFNLIAFNSKAQVWQNRLVDVSETSLEGAWRWIQGLSCWGSTNTYAALQHALGDPGTQAIYLLTDGRPDQPPKSIIAQVQMQHSVPVHTISFNCNDTEANQFMYDLARATGGRYHYFSEKGIDPEGQPESWESEDIRQLKDQLSKGLEDLDRVAELRDECAKLSWKKEIDTMKKCSKNHPMPRKDRVSAVPSMDPQDLYRSATPPPRPSSAPPDRQFTPTPPPRITTSVESRAFTLAKSKRPGSARPTSAKPMKPLAAGHTRTSLLRTLNSRGNFSTDEWLLPETRQLFEKQAERQKKLAQAKLKALSNGDDVEAREERARKAAGRRRKFSRVRSVSSKQWLQKHGLVAKKLTLLDALAPTMIPHKSTYVPILDKHVLAKVFDQVLPLAHVSNQPRKPIKLINPNGVNLQAYEEKLEKAIEMYNRRLDCLVWDAVPQEVRVEEFGDEEGPVSFINNRGWFIKALEEATWPINEQDILLLDEEIVKAERFLQQSKDLRKAANPGYGNDDDDELTVYDDKASNVSGLSARSKEFSRSKESLLSARSKDSISSRSSRSSKNSRSSHHTNPKGSIEVPVRTHPKTAKDPPEREGRSRGRKSQVTTTEDESQLESDTTEREKEEMTGLRVIACHSKDGLYYSGHVARTPEATYAMVNFSFKQRQKVRTQMIIPMSGAIPRPELQLGDYVLVKVFNGTKNLDCYVPAVIEFIPEDVRHSSKFYSVLMYNGQRATTMRKYIVKIGQSRFDMALKYISHLQQNPLKEEKLSSNQSQDLDRSYDGASSDRSLQRSSDRSSQRSTDRSSQRSTDRSSQRSTDRSSQRSSTKGRKKKEKLTKKIGKRPEGKQKTRSEKRKKSRSPSSSSRSSKSRSSSRSNSSRSQSRSRSRSRSKSRSPPRLNSSRTNTSRSRSRSSSRSRSYTSRSRSRSGSSRSRSRSSQPARCRSRLSGRSISTERSRSRSRSRSHSRSLDGRARSDDSSTPRARESPVERPSNPVPKPRPLEPMPRNDSLIDTNITRNDIYTFECCQGYSSSGVANVDEKEQMIGDLQYQLAKQTHKQLRQERRLIRQARKINKIQRKLKSSNQQQNDSLHSDKSRSQRSSDTDTTSPHRRKGSPDGTSYRDTPDLLSIRRSLPGLRVDQEVLARWSDDGWYYRGCISGEGNDRQYIVSDATGHLEAIWREDIMADVDHKYDAIQPRDYVIGLHPKYVFSYAPAEVLDTYTNNSVKVEFYDGNIAKLNSEEVYKIPKAKYKKDVEYVKECEKRIVGKSVVARDDDTGAYRLGVVDDFVGLGQQYFIKWLDGMVCKQTSHHMFEVTQRQMMHESWEHVLAPVDQRNTCFMPAQVVRSEPLKVQFCDGNRSSDVQLDQCFWLSKDYYRNAVEYLHSRKEVLHTRQKVY